MNIEVFALCDAATEGQGKLNLLGAFDTIGAKEIPVVHNQCTVALRIRYSRIESGTHRIRLSIVDGDGRSVIPNLDVNQNIQIRDPEESAVANMLLNIHQLKVEKFGRYSIDLAVDGRQAGSLPLFVRKIPSLPGDPA